MCGAQAVSSESKFCAGCGAQLTSRSGESPAQESKEASKEKALMAVRGGESESTMATESIIESSDVAAMLACIEIAQDDESIEFWYSELITAGSLSATERGQFLLQFVRNHLVPRQRFSEAEFLVEGLLAWDPEFADSIKDILDALASNADEQGTRFELSPTWDNEAYRGPLTPDIVGQKFYEFFVYRLVYSDNEKNEFYRTLMIPDEDTIYQDFFGYYLGLKSNESLDNEIFWHASVTHLRILRKKMEIPSSSFKYMASRVLESKLPPKFSKDALTNFNNK
jgi:hypothetical protein